MDEILLVLIVAASVVPAVRAVDKDADVSPVVPVEDPGDGQDSIAVLAAWPVAPAKDFAGENLRGVG